MVGESYLVSNMCISGVVSPFLGLEVEGVSSVITRSYDCYLNEYDVECLWSNRYSSFLVAVSSVLLSCGMIP